MALINIGLHPNGLHTSTSFKIYKSIVLPRAMYGCELWSNITQSRSVKLEQAHRFCICFMYTKTDVCLSLIGKMPLNFHIDERKLVFVGQICRLAADQVLRSIFCYRLASYYGPFAHNRPQLGFIPSITQLLRKYSLE